MNVNLEMPYDRLITEPISYKLGQQPFIPNIIVDQLIQEYSEELVWYLLNNINGNAKKNSLRAYLFNITANNNYHNQHFINLFQICNDLFLCNNRTCSIANMSATLRDIAESVCYDYITQIALKIPELLATLSPDQQVFLKKKASAFASTKVNLRKTRIDFMNDAVFNSYKVPVYANMPLDNLDPTLYDTDEQEYYWLQESEEIKKADKVNQDYLRNIEREKFLRSKYQQYLELTKTYPNDDVIRQHHPNIIDQAELYYNEFIDKQPKGNNMNQHHNQGQQPGQQYQHPNQGFQNPGQNYQHPNQGYQQPGQNYQHPNQGYQNPGQGYQHPNQGYQNPGQNYQHPNQGFQQPGQQYQHPNQGFQQPGQNYQHPNQGYQQPGQNYQHPNPNLNNNAGSSPWNNRNQYNNVPGFDHPATMDDHHNDNVGTAEEYGFANPNTETKEHRPAQHVPNVKKEQDNYKFKPSFNSDYDNREQSKPVQNNDDGLILNEFRSETDAEIDPWMTPIGSKNTMNREKHTVSLLDGTVELDATERVRLLNEEQVNFNEAPKNPKATLQGSTKPDLNDVLLECNLNEYLTSVEINRVSEEPLNGVTKLNVNSGTIAIPIITKSDVSSYMAEITNSRSLYGMAEVMVDLITNPEDDVNLNADIRRLIFRVNGKLTVVVNNFLKESLGLDIYIEDFTSDILELKHYIKNSFSAEHEKAFSIFEKDLLANLKINLGTENTKAIEEEISLPDDLHAAYMPLTVISTHIDVLSKELGLVAREKTIKVSIESNEDLFKTLILNEICKEELVMSPIDSYITTADGLLYKVAINQVDSESFIIRLIN